MPLNYTDELKAHAVEFATAEDLGDFTTGTSESTHPSVVLIYLICANSWVRYRDVKILWYRLPDERENHAWNHSCWRFRHPPVANY